MLVNDAWNELEAAGAVGTLKRLDENHRCALYATHDFSRRRGLLIIAPSEPPAFPQLKALEITTIADGNGWHTYIWLANPDLAHLFGPLCQDLVDSSRASDPAQATAHISLRLARWRRLFESGTSNTLPQGELRGLIGELAVLSESFERTSPAEAVLAWQGPLGGPQDFAFENMLIEAKTVGPTARRVQIASAHQLDASYSAQLILAVVLLAPAALDVSSGFAVSDFVAELYERLRSFPNALGEFASRLRAAGYSGHPDYANERFRLDGIRYFEVSHEFPRIVRSDLMSGITDASYEIELSVIAPFETVLAPSPPP